MKKTILMLIFLLYWVFPCWGAGTQRVDNKSINTATIKTDKVSQLSQFNENGEPLLVKIDTDNDGIMDRFQYYTGGKITRIDSDVDGDGRIDSRDYFENEKRVRYEAFVGNDSKLKKVVRFDRNGCLAQIEEDSTGNYRFDTIWLFTNPKMKTAQPSCLNSLTEKQRDRNNDGNIDETEFFDTAGLLVKSILDEDYDGKAETTLMYKDTVLNVQEIDQNADGKPETVVFYSDGHQIRQEDDMNGDGKMDIFTHFDSSSAIVKREEATKKDGRIDRVISYKNGKPVKERYDVNNDGYFELTTFFDRTPWSKVVSRDQDANGRIEELYFYKQDSLMRTDYDQDQDGIFERRDHYSDLGKLLKVEELEVGKKQKHRTWIYDREGQLTGAEEDANGDGKVEKWYVYNKGMLISCAHDTNLDGRPDHWEEYGESNSITVLKRDLNFDGQPDVVDKIKSKDLPST